MNWVCIHCTVAVQHVHKTILSHTLGLKFDFIVQSFLVITVYLLTWKPTTLQWNWTKILVCQKYVLSMNNNWFLSSVKNSSTFPLICFSRYHSTSLPLVQEFNNTDLKPELGNIFYSSQVTITQVLQTNWFNSLVWALV